MPVMWIPIIEIACVILNFGISLPKAVVKIGIWKLAGIYNMNKEKWLIS